MIDQKTPNLQFPLPHPNNMLQEDVLRLRAALTNIDGLLWLLNQASITVDLPFFLANGTSKPIRMTINNG